ncbi:MAG: 2-oxo-4-hydroxy-4-carboxy-5-ureidoimidazoline decarboxylase [Bacteroidota bacterium]|nr:2-oxo-4-hydroxy-4-carboxy-5-ureidoimidazoline decarboxylase [Bacteroidota bacterium]
MEKVKINKLNFSESKELFEKCCGATGWINGMVSSKPFNSNEELLLTAEKIWYSLNKEDWLEAFSYHPEIGDIDSLKKKFSSGKKLAEEEQSGAANASKETLVDLAKYNENYKKKFGYIFIVCATGKSADEMLSIIKDRITNEPEQEIKIAMGEQNKITKLRLDKLL